MQLLERPAESGVLAAAGPNPEPLNPGENLLDRVRRRRVLRLGYDLQRIPFCFPNSRGEIICCDFELMHRFAETLQVPLEFVPVSRATLFEQAAADHFDVAGCGFTLTSARAANQPYLDLHAALAVPDHRRHDFASAAELSRETGLTTGVAAEEEWAELLREWIPRANIVRLGNAKDFFAGAKPGIDALFTSAEAGSAMTLVYPNYAVVTPAEWKIASSTVLLLSRTDAVTQQSLTGGLLLRQKNDVTDRLYDHWILGETAERRAPRWSDVQNVLGWLK